MALGIALGAKVADGDKTLLLRSYTEDLSSFCAELFSKIFRVLPDVSTKTVVGRRVFDMVFESSKISEFLGDVDKGRFADEKILCQALGFKCAECASSFLRGVFLSSGSVTDPKKGYHIEFAFSTEQRAALVAKLISGSVGEPKKIKRGERFCLYYKNNAAIVDFLYFIRCTNSGSYVANSCIEMDIRNNENRATNCVAQNIRRSVGAAQKHLIAIEKLIETRKIDSLSDELRYTAKLRIENDSASLSELAMMHEPPLSKSGLNRRLEKLLAVAEDDDK